MNRRHVTLGREAGAFFAVELGNVVVAVVQGSREMGRGATGFATPDRSIIYQHNRATSAREQVRCGHSGDSSANHADIRAEILIERLELRNFGVSHPDGGRTTRVTLHRSYLGIIGASNAAGEEAMAHRTCHVLL